MVFIIVLDISVECFKSFIWKELIEMDSTAEELGSEFLSEKEIIQGRVDSFVQNLKRRQQKNKKRSSKTLKDCIANAPTVTNEMIKVFFE